MPDEKLTLWKIAGEIESVIGQVIDQGGEILPEQEEALAKWQAALPVKVENIVHLIDRLEAETVIGKALEERAHSYRKSRETTIERLRDYVARSMVATDTKKIRIEQGVRTISVQPGRPVLFTAPNELPDDLVDIVVERKPRTKEIKELLKAGREITGATLEAGKAFIVIK